MTSCPRQRIPPRVTHSEVTSLVQARNACGTRCERRFGGCCRLTVCFVARLTPPVLSHTPGTVCGLTRGDVTRPPLERHLNWVPDPVPPPARCPGDLAAPSPSEKAPPRDASSKLPRQLRPRWRRERYPGLSANQNSASPHG